MLEVVFRRPDEQFDGARMRGILGGKLLHGVFGKVGLPRLHPDDGQLVGRLRGQRRTALVPQHTEEDRRFVILAQDGLVPGAQVLRLVLVETGAFFHEPGQGFNALLVRAQLALQLRQFHERIRSVLERLLGIVIDHALQLRRGAFRIGKVVVAERHAVPGACRLHMAGVCLKERSVDLERLGERAGFLVLGRLLKSLLRAAVRRKADNRNEPQRNEDDPVHVGSAASRSCARFSCNSSCSR